MPANTSFDKALSLIKENAVEILGLRLPKHGALSTGQYIPKADAQSPPELSFKTLSPTGTYLVICLDPDAPFPSWPVLGPILHWAQPGLKPTPSKEEPGTFVLEAAEPFVCDYVGPGPPPISSPHRYVFLLYEQPAGFDTAKHAPPEGQKTGVGARMRFSLDVREKELNLGPVVAANYFVSK